MSLSPITASSNITGRLLIWVSTKLREAWNHLYLGPLLKLSTIQVAHTCLQDKVIKKKWKHSRASTWIDQLFSQRNNMKYHKDIQLTTPKMQGHLLTTISQCLRSNYFRIIAHPKSISKWIESTAQPKSV